jgi:hypothetical protein
VLAQQSNHRVVSLLESQAKGSDTVVRPGVDIATMLNQNLSNSLVAVLCSNMDGSDTTAVARIGICTFPQEQLCDTVAIMRGPDVTWHFSGDRIRIQGTILQ